MFLILFSFFFYQAMWFSHMILSEIWFALNTADKRSWHKSRVYSSRQWKIQIIRGKRHYRMLAPSERMYRETQYVFHSVNAKHNVIRSRSTAQITFTAFKSNPRNIPRPVINYNAYHAVRYNGTSRRFCFRTMCTAHSHLWQRVFQPHTISPREVEVFSKGFWDAEEIS